MKAELISIGDEILIGQIVNTNAVWLSKELNRIGVGIIQISSIGDQAIRISRALDEALERADLVLITGGLGPTKDDITKRTLATYFGTGLKKVPEVVAFIKESFAKRNIPFLPVHELQADILENSELVFNHLGTAPGMWIEHKGKIVVSMPGVPYEMKGMMEQYVLPKIQKSFSLPVIQHQTIVCTGIAESTLSDYLNNFEANLPAHIKLAYLPHFGTVRLRLSGSGPDAGTLTREMEDLKAEMLHTIPREFVAALDDLKPEQIVGDLLKGRQCTLGTAESCTGGFLAHLITSVPGSSAYFKGSVIAYSNDVKTGVLGVSNQTLNAWGAVSEACAREMAEGLRNLLQTDFALSTTGIAGPDGGSEEKPVGTVWLALAGPDRTVTRKILANGVRSTVIERAAIQVLDLLRRELV